MDTDHTEKLCKKTNQEKNAKNIDCSCDNFRNIPCLTCLMYQFRNKIYTCYFCKVKLFGDCNYALPGDYSACGECIKKNTSEINKMRTLYFETLKRCDCGSAEYIPGEIITCNPCNKKYCRECGSTCIKCGDTVCTKCTQNCPVNIANTIHINDLLGTKLCQQCADQYELRKIIF